MPQVEGYVYSCYGDVKYLHHVLASVVTLRRFDTNRPVALFCTEVQKETLVSLGFDSYFERIEILPATHRSITGFKHHLDEFMVYDRNLFLDADMIWCKNPDPLWIQFSAFPFTITGMERADFYFGGPKNASVIFDYIFDRRRRTMKRAGLTHLPRIQSGMAYAQDRDVTTTVCQTARHLLRKRAQTHFRSRLDESGRVHESCEWSLAMAMSALNIHVFPWLQGYNSPQLDFIEPLTKFDPDFTEVSCKYYSDRFVYSLRGFPVERIRKFLTGVFSAWPGKGDYIQVTPYTIHFGWLHHKQPFQEFADRVWEDHLAGEEIIPQQPVAAEA